MLSADDHLSRLECYLQDLRRLAKEKKTDKLIEELRGFRADTSWLIHMLEQGKCKPS